MRLLHCDVWLCHCGYLTTGGASKTIRGANTYFSIKLFFKTKNIGKLASLPSLILEKLIVILILPPSIFWKNLVPILLPCS